MIRLKFSIVGFILSCIAVPQVSQAMFSQFVSQLQQTLEREVRNAPPAIQNAVAQIVQNPDVQRLTQRIETELRQQEERLRPALVQLETQLRPELARIEQRIQAELTEMHRQGRSPSSNLTEVLNQLLNGRYELHLPGALQLEQMQITERWNPMNQTFEYWEHQQSYPEHQALLVMPHAERILFRTALIAQLIGNGVNYSGTSENETIKRRDVAIYFAHSLNRLDATYIHAVENTEQNMSAVQNLLETIDPASLGTHGELQKGAAIRRFLTMQQDAQFAGEWNVDYAPRENAERTFRRLAILEILSLAWEAANDAAIFTTPEAITAQHISLVQTLARTQRAHNDDPVSGVIDFNPANQDSPSCVLGGVVRTLESLDLRHPSVQLQPHLQAPTTTQIAHAQLQFAQGFQLNPGERATVIAHPDAQDQNHPAYTRFGTELRQHLVTTFTAITSEQLNAAMTPAIVVELMDHAPSLNH